MAITIQSALYNATNSTLQIQVQVGEASEVFAYSGSSTLTSSTILASGIASGSGSLTLTVPVSGTLTSLLSSLYVGEVTGGIFTSTPAVTSAQVTSASFAAPTAAIAQSAPSAGTQSSSDTITVTATAGSGVASVHILDDGVDLGAATKQADGSYTFTKNDFAPGPHSLTAVVTDNLTATATSSAIIDTVDLTAPVISAIGQTGGGSSNGTQSTSDTIAVTATDISGSGVKSVEIFDGTKDVGAATLSNGTWSKALSGLAPGSHTFTAVATDNAGNVSPSSYSPTVTDLVQPTGVNSIAQTASGSLTNSTSDTIIVTASSTSSSVKSVEIYDTVSGSTTASDLGAATLSNGVWTYNATGLADGTHTFTAVATDSAGNVSTSLSSPTVTDKVDHTAPVVSNVAQSVTAAWTPGTDTITVKTSDATSQVASVEIYGTNGATTTDLGAATSADGLTWTKSLSGLASGTTTFTAVATDSAGNASTLASSPSVTELVQPTGVNTIAQSASGSTTLTPTTIWTSSTSDAISGTASTSAVNGTVSKVEIYDGTKDLGTANVTNGNYTYTASGLASGAHTFAAVVTDSAGNVSTLASSPSVTDYVQPIGVSAVSQSGGSSTGTTSTSDTITVTTGSAATSVEIYDNGKALAAATGSGTSWSYTATGLAQGTNTFAAVATDSTGDVSTLAASPTQTDLVDTTAPVVSAITQSPATGSSTGTQSKSDTITATVSDGSSGSGVASVQFYDGTTALAGGALTNNQDGTWTYTTATNLGDGTHSFRAVATDTAGNASTLASSPSVTDVVDTTVPVAVVGQSASASGWNTVTSDTISVSTIDATSGVKSITVAEDSGMPVSMAATGGSYTFSKLTDGEHTFTVDVTDNAGNVKAQTLSETVDATGPALTINQTGGSTTGTQSTSDSITVSASDALSGLKSLALTEDGTSESLTNGVYNATNLSDGVHTFIATATDNAGNVTTKTITDVVDTTAPVVNSLAASASGTFESITGKVTDATSGVASVAIYDNNGTSNVWLGSTAVNASGNFTLVEAGLAEGAHTFTAVATDNAGNASKAASSPTVTVQVDHTPPVVSAITQSATGSWTTSTSDTITVTASDTGSGVKSVEIYDGTTDLGAATLSNGSWAYTANKLTDGVHSFDAVVTDNAGNVSTLPSSKAVTDEVDTTAPVISAITQTGSSTGTQSTSDTITVTVGDGNGSGVKSVEIYDGKTDLGAATLSNGSWAYTANGLTNGTHIFDAVVTDNAGNVSTLPSSKAVTDLVGQAAPFVSAIAESASASWTQSTSDTITVTATSANTVKSVEIYDGTKDLGAATLSNGSWAFTANGLADGTHTFGAVVTDNTGVSTLASSPTVTDKVDTTAPTIGSPSQNASGTWTSSTSDTISVAASDGGSGIASVAIYDNGNYSGAATLSNGSYVYTASGLSDGANVFTAKATDNAGNMTNSAGSVTDMVDHNGVPTIGAISETTLGKSGEFGVFKFDVSNLVGAAAGPNTAHVTYWIDATATDTAAPASGWHWGCVNTPGTGTETLTLNDTGNIGDYLHVQAVDTTGHASTIGTTKIA